MPRDEQPARYGRIDVAATNMSHSLKQDDAALNVCFVYVLLANPLRLGLSRMLECTSFVFVALLFSVT